MMISMITNCKTCLKYKNSQNNRNDQNEGAPLEHEVPITLFTKIAPDLFTFDKNNYLSVVDYMLKFQGLPKVVTEVLKSIIAEYSLPRTLVSDNIPCFAAEQLHMKYELMECITEQPPHITTREMA